ncbi:hypothetical protein DEJ50_02265 [Streptomyces venezuelae]|uniref:HAF repeat-containing protein n=2 Tax=Streptomyces venezuelae TaxID=54571 RepID=A0A5P2CVH3_STRVZ|nr:hypothetical protein DEJ50_02265 [Streptomyces venezuelae]
MAAGAAAVALAALIGTTGPASAAGPVSGSGTTAGACKPGLSVLGALPGPEAGWLKEGVRALGKGNLSVGSSRAKAVYWTGTTVRRVPVPDAQASGELLAVNANGLMAGRYTPTGSSVPVAFTYRAGDAAVTPLPAGTNGSVGLDLNDSGRVVAAGSGLQSLLVVANGTVERTLTFPEGIGADARVEHLGGINARGDVVATVNWPEPDTGGRVEHSVPVLWPGDGGPARLLTATGNTSWVADIAADGTVVGSDWFGFGYEWRPRVWAAADGGVGSSPAPLSTHSSTSLDGISPTTGVVAGTARVHIDDLQLTEQAVLWPGSGPVLALPRLAAGKASEGVAVSDDDRVGGSAVNANGKTRAVIWKCASAQAYTP